MSRNSRVLKMSRYRLKRGVGGAVVVYTIVAAGYFREYNCWAPVDYAWDYTLQSLSVTPWMDCLFDGRYSYRTG